MKLETIYKKSDKWISITPLIWSPLAILTGLFLVDPFEALVIPLMGLFMYFMASWGVYFVLHIQKQNPFIKNEKIITFFNVFCWGFGLLGALQFLFSGLYLYFSPTEDLANAEYITNTEFGYYLLQVWFFPLGVTLGASKSLLTIA